MGGPIQEILSGRGDKERKKFLIQRISLFASLAVLSGFSNAYPSFSIPYFWFLWFIAAGAVFFWAAHFAFIREGRRSYFELLLFSPVLVTGLSLALGKQGINFLVVPYVIFLVFNFSFKETMMVTLLLPVANLGGIIRSADAFTLSALYSAAFVSAVVTGRMLGNVRKAREDAEAMLASIKNAAKEGAVEAASISDESVMSDFLAKLRKTDEELMNVLMAAKAAFVSDCAMFFESDLSGNLKFRCSTEDGGTVIPTGGGLLERAFKNRQDLVGYGIRAKKTDPGYIRNDDFDSLAIACVRDGNYFRGALVVDSDRYRAFIQTDGEKLRMFADVVSMILERARIYNVVNNEHISLRTLKEESSQFVSTLDINELSKKIVEGAYRICGGGVVLFLKEEGKRTYRLAYAQGLHTPEKTEYVLGDTLLDLALKNEQNIYLGDISSHKGKVLPFKYENISSVLCMPLIYEGRILGVVASVSKRKNAFTFHQNYYDMWILDVFITLSRMSLANAFNHEKLAQISKTDGLTGLFNHRHFQERIEEELKRVSRSRAPLSLILADIDHFKKVNDSYGHPAGDAVLKGVSRIIRDRIRETDIAARYGGEEFALILTNTDSVGARKFADELRQAIQKNPFTVDGKTIPVTISLGISSLPPVAQSKEEVIEKADRALYFAKKNGRNRAVLWSEVRN